MPEIPSCATCRFRRPVTWKGPGDDIQFAKRYGRGGYGECHLSGPIAPFGSGPASWPITADGDWCGDYRPQDPDAVSIPGTVPVISASLRAVIDGVERFLVLDPETGVLVEVPHDR